jgi:hypothetical protein
MIFNALPRRPIFAGWCDITGALLSVDWDIRPLLYSRSMINPGNSTVLIRMKIVSNLSKCFMTQRSPVYAAGEKEPVATT